MFGLMLRNSCRLHEDAREQYRLHHCGTCKAVGQQFSHRSRLFLNFDCVFLAELLAALSEERTETWPQSIQSFNCFAKEETDQSIPLPLRYAAATNVLLAALKTDDHLRDKPSVFWRMANRLLRDDFQKAETEMENFGLDVDAIWDWVEEQQRRERQHGTLEYYAEPTARITAAVFERGAALAGAPTTPMRDLGYGFGKLVYILDALEDLEKDRKNRQFNALDKVFSSVDKVVKREVADRLLALSKQLQQTIRQLPLPQTTQDDYCARLSANVSARVANALERRKPSFQNRKQRFIARWALRYQNARTFARQLTEDKPAWMGAPQYALTFLAVMVSPRLPQEIGNASGDGIYSSTTFAAVMVGFFTLLRLRRRIKRIYPAFKRELRRLKKQLKGDPETNEDKALKTLLWIFIITMICTALTFLCLYIECTNSADDCGDSCVQCCCDFCCEASCES